eukprot:gnl/Chilomastix_caulleri/355.p2 GENE.gnl/Chilomastix_caulleri/355~~gnl/Chilomastix_caulleri/355.p2  ORF type:complete len:84 (+),score=16.45 gnl/Chilomastix_caulleri/355:244-495(+)
MEEGLHFVTPEGFEHIRSYLELPEGTKPEIAERVVEERQKRAFSGRQGENVVHIKEENVVSVENAENVENVVDMVTDHVIQKD